MPTTRPLALSVLTTLLAACGQAPAPSADTAAAALATDPCTSLPCDWHDLGPQPLHTNAVVMHSMSLNTVQGLPMVAFTSGSLLGPPTDALVRVKSGPAWEAATRLNDAGQGSDPALARLGSRTALPAIVAFSEQRPGADAVIRLKTRSTVNGASVWTPFDPQSGAGLSALGTPGSDARDPSVVVTSNPTFVAWEEFSPTNRKLEVFVQSYRNGVWTNLGTRPDGSLDDGSLPQLAINADNRMALAYEQGGVLAPRLVVRKWNGASFALLPDPSPRSVAFGDVSVGVASGGDPVVAFTEFRGDVATLIVRERTGHGTWVTLGGPLNVSPSANAVHPSLVASGSQLSVAWTEFSGPLGVGGAHLKRWNAGTQTWDALGGQINPDRSAEDVSLALDGAGHPLTALSLTQPPSFENNELRVRAWGPAQLR